MTADRPSTLTVQTYRQHQQRQKVQANEGFDDFLAEDALTVIQHCTCEGCDHFRKRFPTLAAKIESDIYLSARRAILVMQSYSKEVSSA